MGSLFQKQYKKSCPGCHFLVNTSYGSPTSLSPKSREFVKRNYELPPDEPGPANSIACSKGIWNQNCQENIKLNRKKCIYYWRYNPNMSLEAAENMGIQASIFLNHRISVGNFILSILILIFTLVTAIPIIKNMINVRLKYDTAHSSIEIEKEKIKVRLQVNKNSLHILKQSK